MADSIYTFDPVAANNTSLDTIPYGPNQLYHNQIDNWFRSLASKLAQFVDDLGAANTVGGTGDAVTVTLASGITAYATAQMFRFIAGAANTGPATMNVNGIGAKAIRKISGGTDVALATGDIAAGETYLVIYRASANAAAGAWVLIGATPSNMVTTDGTQTLTNKTLTAPTLTLKQSASPTPTAEGDIQWDTDDNAIVVGDGSSQKTFRANAREVISFGAFSAVSSVDVTGLSAFVTLFLTAYVLPATDGVNVLLRTDANGGASYDAGASDYTFLIASHNSVSANTFSGATGNTTGMLMNANAVGNASNEGIQFEVILSRFNKAEYCKAMMFSNGVLTDGSITNAHASLQRNDATARDALRIIASTGNISGNYLLEGVRG